MAYIVKSSLDIGGKIIPWNEQEVQKLVKEKKEIIKNKETSKIEEMEKFEEEIPEKVETIENEEYTIEYKNNKKNKKAGEK